MKKNIMKAVIFDMDGVLIDSGPLHFISHKTLLKRLNIEITENYLDKYVGVAGHVTWKEIINEFNIETDLQEILEMKLSLELRLLKQGDYDAIEGIPELVKELYVHNIPIGVASSSPSIFMKEVLKQIRIEQYITAWVSGENIEKSKPEPDIFLRTAELLQVHPEECIVIEDSMNGVVAAKKAGMKCIGFNNINTWNQDLSNADVIVDKIQEINMNIMKKYFKERKYVSYEANV